MSLSQEKQNILAQFRDRVDDCIQPHHDDYYLTRWLIARDFDLNRAEKMFRNHLDWRKRMNADEFLYWEPPEVLVKYYPYGFTGFDKAGCPVWILPTKNCDLRGILRSAKLADNKRYMASVVERSLHQLRQFGKEHYKQSGIIDLEGFSFSQFSWPPVVELLISMTQMFEANYPDMMKKAYIINAPRVFSVVFNLVKPLLSEFTLAKFCIYGPEPEKWKKALLEDIPADQLPVHWGGTKVDPVTGDAHCSTIIRHVTTVPQQYYLDQQPKIDVSGLLEKPVPRGSTVKIPFHVSEEGSTLKWRFVTRDYDIGFSLKFDSNDSGYEKDLLPLERVQSHLQAEEGSWKCERIGTYYIIFDNTFSRLRAKKVYYRASVLPPQSSQNNERSR